MIDILDIYQTRESELFPPVTVNRVVRSWAKAAKLAGHENIDFLHQTLVILMGSRNAGIIAKTAKISGFHCVAKYT